MTFLDGINDRIHLINVLAQSPGNLFVQIPYSENEDGLKFLVKIIKSLIGHDVDFINNENE